MCSKVKDVMGRCQANSNNGRVVVYIFCVGPGVPRPGARVSLFGIKIANTQEESSFPINTQLIADIWRAVRLYTLNNLATSANSAVMAPMLVVA